MTRNTVAAGLAVAMILPAAALAADFDDMDANGDGVITMSEFQDAMPDAPAGTFTAADSDSDGVLSVAEFEAAQDAGLLPASDG